MPLIVVWNLDLVTGLAARSPSQTTPMIGYTERATRRNGSRADGVVLDASEFGYMF